MKGTSPVEQVDYSEYDNPSELIEGMIEKLKSTELNSVGWSMYKEETLSDLQVLKEEVESE